MTERNILINRAPVLTLWATNVAYRLGFEKDEALSLGKAVAGLNAQSKTQRLGIFKTCAHRSLTSRAAFAAGRLRSNGVIGMWENASARLTDTLR